MSHYDSLGVPRDAPPEEVKRAYRKKAVHAHPDRGGNEQEFHAIQRAYDVLGDPSRREQYDRTGEDGQTDARSVALGTLATVMSNIMDQADVDHTDILAVARDHVNGEIAKMHAKISDLKKKRKARERALKRLSRKKVGENVMALIFEGNMRDFTRAIEGLEQHVAIAKDMLEILAEYNYRVDKGVIEQAPQMAQFFLSR